MSKTYDEHLDEQEERGRKFRQDEPVSELEEFTKEWVNDPENGIDVNIISEDLVVFAEDLHNHFMPQEPKNSQIDKLAIVFISSGKTIGVGNMECIEEAYKEGAKDMIRILLNK